MINPYKVAYYILLSLFPQLSYSQLIVDSTSHTSDQLINEILLGGGVTATNIQYKGSLQAVGYFNGSKSNIGLDDGIILSTGYITTGIGPNNDSGLYTDDSLGTQGDQDLRDSVIRFADSYDAAVLEFDFIPVGDSLSFLYVFASEHYPELVCSPYNDGFGFFLDGPNPAGGFYNRDNIALIPGKEVPVAINTVNSGQVGAILNSGACDYADPNWRDNSIYFVDNGDGSPNTPQYTDSTVVQYNGFTTVLTAKAAVVPCQSYHIKLAIADGLTAQFNSAVFLGARSFSGGLEILTESLADSNFVDEGCETITINFIRHVNLDSLITIKINQGGSAVNGTDYTGESGGLFPDSIVFPAHNAPLPSSDTITLRLKPAFDGLPEGLENVILNVINSLGCAPDTALLEFWIKDVDPIQLPGSTDVAICRGESKTLTAQPTGGTSPYSYIWDTGETAASITVSPADTTIFHVTVTDNCNVVSKPLAMTVNVRPDPVIDSLYVQDATCKDSCNALVKLALDSSMAEVLWEAESMNGHYEIEGLCPGNYSVMLTDTHNCIAGYPVPVKSSPDKCALPDPVVPNVFTPNGDGVNDRLVIRYLDFEQWHLSIYNRWGNRVFRQLDYTNKWEAENIPDGVYYYVLTNPSDHRAFNGFLHIIR